MKHSLVLTALLAGAAAATAPASAADDIPPEFRSSTFEIYLGAFGSGNLIQSSIRENIAGAPEGNLDGNGFGYGIRGGVDYVMDGWVLGAVADWSFGFDEDLANDGDYDADLAMPHLATIRARAGYTEGIAMVYVTGGYAQAEMELDVRGDGIDTPKGFASDWAPGWVLGAGVDVALTQQVSMGLEYLYVNLEDASFRIGPDTDPAHFEHEIDAIHSIRLGVNYAFQI